MQDFFISYNRADKSWAEWIAWQLEDAGYATLIQAWDFRPGSNFVLEMQKAATETQRTIAVLSPDYLKSDFLLSPCAQFLMILSIINKSFTRMRYLLFREQLHQ